MAIAMISEVVRQTVPRITPPQLTLIENRSCCVFILLRYACTQLFSRSSTNLAKTFEHGPDWQASSPERAIKPPERTFQFRYSPLLFRALLDYHAFLHTTIGPRKSLIFTSPQSLIFRTRGRPEGRLLYDTSTVQNGVLRARCICAATMFSSAEVVGNANPRYLMTLTRYRFVFVPGRCS